MEGIKVFNIVSPKTIQSWKEKFDCLYHEDNNALFVSKEEFISDEDPDIKDYHFRFAVECWTWWENHKCTWSYALKLVVCPQFIDKKLLSSIANCAGVNEDEVDIQDIIAHGGADVTFGCETSKGENLDYNIITNIANVFESMNAFRGWFLDKNWNGYLTGWHVIKHCVMGEDMFKKMC